MKILFWNYKRLPIQPRSSRPELLCKKVFITSQNSQESIYTGVSLLTELEACDLCNFILKESSTQVFSCQCEIFKYTIFNEHIVWLLLSCIFFTAMQMWLRKKTRRIILTRGMLIQNSYSLLIIFLAANRGWPPAANFTLVYQTKLKATKRIVFHVNIITLEALKWTRLFSCHKNLLVVFTPKTTSFMK